MKNLGENRSIFYKYTTISAEPIKKVNLRSDEEIDSGLCSTNEDINDYNQFSFNKKEPILESEVEIKDVNEKTPRKNQTYENSILRPFLSMKKSFNRGKSDRNISVSTMQLLKVDDPKENLIQTSSFQRKFSVVHSSSNNLNRISTDDLVLKRNGISRNQNIRFDMPSLIEINEQTTKSKSHSNSLMPNPSVEPTTSLPNHLRPCNIIINDCDSNNNTLTVSSNTNLAQTADTGKPNILNSLEYLINNSKSNFNTKLAIANIAAAAAISESEQSNSNTGEAALQTLIMDLVVPPHAVSSQFDLSSTASTDPIDFSLIYQHQMANDNLNNLSLPLGSKQPVDYNNNFNNSFNTKKQINEQIMRTCMGYLDYLNKKHSKERRIQTIRNKISGFVLLTIVFLMIFGLALVMAFFLTKSLTKMITQNTNASSEPYVYTDLKHRVTTTFKIDELKPRNLGQLTLTSNISSIQNESTVPVKPRQDTNEMPSDTADSMIRNEIKSLVKGMFKNIVNKVNLDRTNLEKTLAQLQQGILNMTINTLQSNTENNNNQVISEES